MAEASATARRVKRGGTSSKWHCAWCNPGSPPEGYTSGICEECLERELAALRPAAPDVSERGRRTRPSEKRPPRAA
jgi:hypothetical protein